MKKILLNSSVFLMVFLLVFSVFFSGNVLKLSARTLEEIAAEKKQKEAELNQLKQDLAKAEKDLANSRSRQKSSLNSISDITARLEEIDNNLKVNDLKIKELESQIDLKRLEHEQKKAVQNRQVVDSYIIWKTDDITSKLFVNQEDILKTYMYYDYVTYNANRQILGLADELSRLNSENELNLKEKEQLLKELVDLEEQKKLLARQIEEYNRAIANANKNADGIRSRTTIIQRELELLSAEQAAIIDQDNQTTDNNNNGGTQQIGAGQFYISGRGRDLYQGHGDCLSQCGAYGLARLGWTGDQIVTFYYTQTHVEVRSGLSMTVQGYGTMSADNYVAGLGEIPSRACGSFDQINAWNEFANSQGWAGDDPKRSKYIIDNPETVWDCWPEEAIKAQVIAARSYGVTSFQPICTSASCQVYVGGQAKAWAAFETSNKYIVSGGATHNNQIIRALYSSDNNQGFGTANNDTVFSNFGGDGTPSSYLRHVDDSQLAGSYTYTNWTWRTNGYNMNNINELFTWAANNYNSGGANSFMRSIKSTVGTVTSLVLEKDNSNRVKKVKVIGTNGEKYMAGWLFKAVWNSWVANVRPSGQLDYIYSTTFNALTG